jgi:hypothetical protein
MEGCSENRSGAEAVREAILISVWRIAIWLESVESVVTNCKAARQNSAPQPEIFVRLGRAAGT